MPFKSEKQRRYLWAKHPEVAREFAHAEKRSRRTKKTTKRRRKRAGS